MSRLLKKILIIPALLAGSICAGATAYAATPATQVTTLKMGFLYDFAAANVWTMDDCLAKKGVRLDMTPFTQWADVQRAFQSGQVQLGVMGYQNLAQMVGAGFTSFKAIAGVNNGDTFVIVRNGERIPDWKAVAGKKVGVPPNSFSDMIFRAEAAKHGVDLKSINFVNFPGAGPPMLAALKQGAIDMMVAWEPNPAHAEAMGIGHWDQALDVQQGAIGKANSVLYATDEVIHDEHAAVQSVVDCLVQRTRELSNSPKKWASVASAKTGTSPDVAKIAIPRLTMDTTLYPDAAKEAIRTFAKFGLVKDISASVPKYLDQRFLQAAGVGAD